MNDYEHLLGKIPDCQIAKRFEDSYSTIRKKRIDLGIPVYNIKCPYDHLLGTKPDTAIAKEFGVSIHAVFYRREKLNIPVYRPTTDYDHLLGTMPDTKIAEAYGISRQAVSERRNKLNIDPYTPPPKEPKPPRVKSKMGRPTIRDRPMTKAEIQRRFYAKSVEKFNKEAT